MSDDSTYRFDPTEFREGEETDDARADDADGPATPSVAGRSGESRRNDRSHDEAREFDWRGWVLVGMLFVAFVFVPVLLYFVPRAQWLASSLGLGYRDAFLVLPLVPALLLGALAVWATTRP